MIGWYNNEAIWNTLSKEEKAKLAPFREKIARLDRFGYTVTQFNPGVKFIDPDMAAFKREMDYYDRQVSMDAGAWNVFDMVLTRIESLNRSAGFPVNEL